MGTDSLGSDVFSRVVYGARISVEASLISVGLAIVVGVPLGLVSGYFRGVLGRVGRDARRGQHPGLPVPDPGARDSGDPGRGLGLRDDRHRHIAFVPDFVRITRAQVLTVRGLDYVEAAGPSARVTRIMTWHLLPNSLPPILVQTTLAMGYAYHRRGYSVLPRSRGRAGGAELGLDALPGPVLPTSAWWMAFFPGMAIFFAVLGFNLLGRRRPRGPRSTNLRLGGARMTKFRNARREAGLLDALSAFIRTENFEEREQERGLTDRAVLEFMKERSVIAQRSRTLLAPRSSPTKSAPKE